jgi:hypothetical protein
MSLDVSLFAVRKTCVFDANITHNLIDMATMAGIYDACWQPNAICVKTAKDIIPLLEEGLRKLKERPGYFRQFDSPNGWGKYENFVLWVERYLVACKENPDAEIQVSK